MACSLIVGVSGNITRPSRTSALLSAILAEIGSLAEIQSRLIELVDIGPHLFRPLAAEQVRSFSLKDMPQDARSAFAAIKAADALVVGTPVYKGSYTGALKHLFDLVPPDALTGKPVLLAASAGSSFYGLVTEHELRPLFGFFNAVTLPTTVFALESDFSDYSVAKPELMVRIKRAAAELTDWLSMRLASRRASAT
jgi:FMN reductase